MRQWLMARTDLFRFEVAPLLVGLHALAARVDVEAFDVAIRKGISGEQTLPTILELIAEIADTLCRGLTGIEEDIVHKSLQETLFHCIGLELDLSVTECGKNFQTFLDQRGSRGFIRLSSWDCICSMSFGLNAGTLYRPLPGMNRCCIS